MPLGVPPSTLGWRGLLAPSASRETLCTLQDQSRFAVCKIAPRIAHNHLIEMHGKCQEVRVEESPFDIASVLPSLISSGQCICLVSGL